ncbi:hypothetical protein DICPUDRAFT_34601 [Dictyostelium purpureum]|uniref:G-protein coupled receptors family 2 profile 2 domain-containing protein n=1 Tax=Dictyostelium purpureum TaxID=5786 RepID=F0ZN01_DICPU|nr:uncharacterized protein DICPUDRAFT_34601 [Dictyostelium purpureum]EGC34657.1 hypothetical protein DICPUDRAFT_34601 [Dictyostelium purpureum]|eukprot:XP_003288794.1 hypothetical protein DICPUDRAFT_34601 [Dictyostelium purpureum]
MLVFKYLSKTILLILCCIIVVNVSSAEFNSNNNNIDFKNVFKINNNSSIGSNNNIGSGSSITSSISDDSGYDHFTKEQIEKLDSIVYISSGMGCAGALFIIITFILFKDVRSFATKLIFFLSLSDLMSAISYLPFGRRNTVMCNLQGMGLVFFLSSSYFWTMCISISLFVVFFTSRYELNHWLKYFHMVCWGIPFITALVSLLFHAYGRTASWCFLYDPTSVFRLLYYVPLIAVFFINLLVFVAIRWKISQHSNSLVSKVNIIVSFYLIAFTLSQLPTIINSFQNFSKPNDPQFSLYAFQLLLQPLQGFLNCIVYGINEGFTKHYIYFFEKHICRCRKSRELKEIESDRINLLVDYDTSDEEDIMDHDIDKLIIDDYDGVGV